MVCNNCGKEIKDNSKFCTSCGTRVETIKANSENTNKPDSYTPHGTQICKKCGRENLEGKKFCTSCGNPFIQQDDTMQMPVVKPKPVPKSSKKKSKNIVFLTIAAVLVITIVVGAIVIPQFVDVKDEMNGGYRDEYNESISGDSYYYGEEQDGETQEKTDSYVDEDGVIVNSKLANSYQKILGSGVDEDGNIYEVVATVEESYQGSELLVGVIKNSAWLIEPNSECPFVLYSDWDKNGKDIDDIEVCYLGNGTFYNTKKDSLSRSVTWYGVLELWNVENGNYLFFDEDVSCDTIDEYDQAYDDLVVVKSEIHGINEKCTLVFVDTRTLDTEEKYSVITRRVPSAHQISDGLYYTSIDFQNKIDIGTFNDVNGNKVFDLSEIITDETTLVSVSYFQNGKGRVVVKLENGTKFEVIFDKKGSVIENNKINE